MIARAVVVLAFVASTFPLSGLQAGAATAAADSGDTLRLSLEDCVMRAIDVGEEMRIADDDYATARALYLQARSTALPQINVSTNYTRQIESVFRQSTGPTVEPFEPDTLAPVEQRVRDLEKNLPTAWLAGLGKLFGSTAFGSKNTWVASIGLSQKLLEGGSIWNSIAAAKHAIHSARNSKLDKREDVVLKVREAYLAALLADRGVRIASLGLEQAESQLQRVRLRQEAGEASEFELLQAEVQHDNQIPAVLQAKSMRELAYLELGRLANLPSMRPVALTTPLLDDVAIPPRPAEVDTTGLVALALKGSGIVALEEAVAARDRAIPVAASSRWPALSLFADYSEQAYPTDLFPKSDNWKKNVSAGLLLSWSLFDGMRTKGSIQESKAKRSQTLQALQQTRELVREAVIQSQLDLQRAAADLHARSRTVELAKRALDLASLRYDEGASDLLEVSDARIAYQIAQTNEARARHDYFVALARLERYSGRPLFTSAAPAGGGQR